MDHLVHDIRLANCDPTALEQVSASVGDQLVEDTTAPVTTATPPAGLFQAEWVDLVLTADASKYKKKGFALMFPLTRLDLLITDKGMPEPARQELREAGLQLITV